MKTDSRRSLGNSIMRSALGAGLVLLVPLVAMQFSDEVKWDAADFITIGTILFVTGMIYEQLVRKISDPRQRAIAAVVLFLTLFLVWIELAVGIFD